MNSKLYVVFELFLENIMFAFLFQTTEVRTRLGDSLLILYVRTIVAAIG